MFLSSHRREENRPSLFPMILTLLMVVIAMFFLAPIAFWPTGHGLADARHGGQSQTAGSSRVTGSK